MNDKFKPLPRNINKEKLEQFSKDFSFELTSLGASPMSQFINEYSIKVKEKLDDEIFGVCTQIALANGIKHEYAINKEFFINAMQKAIASSPLFIYGDYDLPICPDCSQLVDDSENYCSVCGKKLDWSEINEPIEPTETNFEACQTDFD